MRALGDSKSALYFLMISSVPVSYTHLDVYKRQAQHLRQLVQQFFLPGIAAALPGKTLHRIGAVSYTHLDVYKRQPPKMRRGAVQPFRLALK